MIIAISIHLTLMYEKEVKPLKEKDRVMSSFIPTKACYWICLRPSVLLRKPYILRCSYAFSYCTWVCDPPYCCHNQHIGMWHSWSDTALNLRSRTRKKFQDHRLGIGTTDIDLLLVLKLIYFPNHDIALAYLHLYPKVSLNHRFSWKGQCWYNHPVVCPWRPDNYLTPCPARVTSISATRIDLAQQAQLHLP